MADLFDYRTDIMPEQEKRHPGLVDRLRDMARQLGRERSGGITSADVIAALETTDPTLHKHLQIVDRRLMGAVFARSEWMQTGERRKTGSHKREQPVWVLKEAVAA